MSNSTSVLNRSVWATIATALVTLVLAAAMVGLSGMSVAADRQAVSPNEASSSSPTESPTESPSPTETPTSSPTPTATPTSDGPAYPEAQGWKNQSNGVKYHIDHDKGYVLFWTTMKDSYGMLAWESKVLESDNGASFWYGSPPKKIKYRQCGKSVKIEIYGYNYPQLRTLPALKCKSGTPTTPSNKHVNITKVKKVKVGVKVFGRTGASSQVLSSRLVVQDLTKTTYRRCAWVKPNGKLKYTPRAGGVCSAAKAPFRSVGKKTAWSRVVKVPKYHRFRAMVMVHYKDASIKRDQMRFKRR